MLLAGSLASQSTPERRSKSREGKTTFDWLLRHCFVHTQTQKSWAAENTNQNWNINGGIAWERRLISGRCFSVFSTDGEKEMKKGRGPPDHRLGERALSLSSASPSYSSPPFPLPLSLSRYPPRPERLEQANPFASCVLVRELRKKDLFLKLVSW